MSERISGQQLTWLYINFHLGVGILFLPGILVTASQQDAWITVLLSAILGLGMVMIWTTLAMRFPGTPPALYFTAVCGRPVGTVLVLLMVGYFFWLSAVILRELLDFFAITYPETPIRFMIAVSVIVCIYIMRNGLEVIARVNDLLFVMVVGSLVLIALLALPQYRFDFLQPVLQKGWGPVLKGMKVHIAFPYADSVVFLFVFPYLRNQLNVRKNALMGMSIGAGFILLSVITTIMTLGVMSATRTVYPPHVVARTITVASFIGGLDGFIDIVWVASSIMVLLVVLFALCSAVADLFPLPSYQKISLPIVVMVGIYSMYVFKNFIAEINFDQKVFPYMSLGAGVAIPLVCLLVAMIRGTRGTPLIERESEGA